MPKSSVTLTQSGLLAALDLVGHGHWLVERFKCAAEQFLQSHTYSELRQQIHDELRIQHPEWVQPNGKCLMCDFYEARLMYCLDSLTRMGPYGTSLLRAEIGDADRQIDSGASERTREDWRLADLSVSVDQ